jgi:hypothetical protein
MLRHREFEVAELSLSSYAVSLFSEQRPFIAIPVFPSRFFRHSCIYVNSAANIRTPRDLIGRRKTRIFPIMHTVAIRRDVYEQNRWIAQSLCKAFAEAQRRTYEDLHVTAALKAMVPWLTSHIEETCALMGDDFWAYGIEPNRASLATFLRYHHEQGLSKRLLEAEELFAPETLSSFKI